MITNAIAIFIYIFLCTYSFKKNKIIQSLAALIFLLLGVLQIFYFTFNDISGEISVFYTTHDSFIAAQFLFLILGLIGLIYMFYSNESCQPLILVDHKYKTSPAVIIATSGLVLMVLVFGLNDIDSGRPSFSGIGVALGILMALSIYQLTLFDGLIHKIFGIFALFTIFVFSRILGVNVILAVLIYMFYVRKNKKIKLTVIIPLMVALLMLFLFLGQIKHLIGQGYSIGESVYSTVGSFEWLMGLSADSNAVNLGIDLNYRIGIELGTSLADCINGGEFDPKGVAYIIYDFFTALIPGFLYRLFGVDLNYSLNFICGNSIVRAPVVDFYRSLGVGGVILYGFLYWGFLSLIDKAILKTKSRVKVIFLCILAVNSLMLIRGTIGSFVSFTVAVLVCTFFIVIFLRKDKLRSNCILSYDKI
jgi:hypothetical protein